MKCLLLLFIAALIFACKSKTEDYGSVSGNVYWKYNNFIGNRPDAGSRATLYSMTDSTLQFSAVADVRGDYSFDSIPAGNYVLIIRSKNTTGSASDNIREILGYSGSLSTIFNCNLETLHNSDAYQSVLRFDSLYYDATRKALDSTSDYKYASLLLQQSNHFEDSANKAALKVIDKLPVTVKAFTGVVGPASNKLSVDFVTVEKNRNSNKVTDFGITYL